MKGIYPVVPIFNRLQLVYQRQPPASRHPDATLVNGGANLFASRDTAIREGLAELSFGSQQMKKTKAELALFVQKAFLNEPLSMAVKRPALLLSNKTAVHA